MMFKLIKFEKSKFYVCKAMEGSFLTSFEIMNITGRLIEIRPVNHPGSWAKLIQVNEMGVQFVYPFGRDLPASILLASNPGKIDQTPDIDNSFDETIDFKPIIKTHYGHDDFLFKEH